MEIWSSFLWFLISAHMVSFRICNKTAVALRQWPLYAANRCRYTAAATAAAWIAFVQQVFPLNNSNNREEIVVAGVAVLLLQLLLLRLLLLLLLPAAVEVEAVITI